MVRLMDSEGFEGRMQWDTYKRFHIKRNYGIVQFDTGEVILTQSGFDPDVRGKTYGGLVFLMGADRHNVLNCLYDSENDRKVLKSWLPNGTYYMADMDTRQFIVLHRWNNGNKDNPLIPQNIAEHIPVAYHGGPGRKWTTGAKLEYTRTVRPDSEQRKHVQNIVMLCRAQQRVGAIPDTARFDMAKPGWSRWGAAPWSDVMGTTFENLLPGERDIIARYGVEPPREHVKVSELVIREV